MSLRFKKFQTVSRRTKLIGAFGAATLLVTVGCQDPMKLPVRKAGAKCSPVGAQARTSTHVLECKPNRRWTKVKTLAQARTEYAQSLVPTVTAPRPAPTTVPAPVGKAPFGGVSRYPVGRGANAIDPGTYLTTVRGSGGCGIERRSPDGTLLGDRFAWEGPTFFEIPDAPARITTKGGCLWALASAAPQPIPASGDAVYRVGTEIQPGRYTAPGDDVDDCYWETATSADGSTSAITDYSFSTGPQMVEIAATDKFFASSGCGPWTALPVLPSRYFELIGNTADWVTQGQRSFSQGNAVQMSAVRTTDDAGVAYDLVNAQLGGLWTIAMNSRTGTLHDGTYTFENNEPTLSFYGDGRGCSYHAGTFTVSNVQRDADGVIDGLDLEFLMNCDAGSGFAYGMLHVEP